ncbi:MAG: hypothetical protein IIC29_03440 [Chloroflexi bacterium]|nr:hypothetical protein [Chloroflexota bacterium]
MIAAYNEQPDAVVIDLDPQWLLSVLTLVDGISDVTRESAIILVAARTQPVTVDLVRRLAKSDLSFVRRRHTDSGERVVAALESALSGTPWLDPEVQESVSSFRG